MKQPYLKSKDLFQHYLDTVGRGANYILNIPPSTAGAIPPEFATEAALLGTAIRNSFDEPVAEASSLAAGLACGGEQGGSMQQYATMQIDAGVAVDAVVAKEEIALGQSIASYSLELQASGSSTWTAVAGVHAGTVGSMLIDVLPVPITGPATLRWSCTASAPKGTKASLLSLQGFKLTPPTRVAPARPKGTAQVGAADAVLDVRL
jgi:alpha-L-fucosidase